MGNPDQLESVLRYDVDAIQLSNIGGRHFDSQPSTPSMLEQTAARSPEEIGDHVIAGNEIPLNRYDRAASGRAVERERAQIEHR